METKLITTGADLIARAAVDAGCRFFAGYPITPASPIMAAMIRLLQRTGGVGFEAEDEIAAFGLCLGASATGEKVMTATSGPGISLYSESIGLAQMTELPIVIVNAQRMGPATGGATTNAEGDIQFVRWCTSGGYPVLALCPSTAEECYTLTFTAFDWAERFRTPVFLLTSKDMVTNRETVDTAALVPPSPERVRRRFADPERYPAGRALPYAAPEPDSVPDFAPLGGDLLSRVNTSTHDEDGNLVRSPPRVDRALRRLAHKIEARRAELERVDADVDPDAPVCIIAYGLCARTSREVVARERERGRRISLVTVHSLWPVPEAALRAAVGRSPVLLVPEHNLGQYVLEIMRIFPDRRIVPVNRIDGPQISPAALHAAVAPAYA